MISHNKSNKMSDKDKITHDHRRSLKYDSTDSSDSGVCGDSNVWSPCSSIGSYSPPPTLTDEEQTQSRSPSPPDTNAGSHLSCMAPNDASRPPHKSSPVDANRLMGRCVLGANAPTHVTSILESPSLLKEKPPDDNLRVVPLRSPRLAKTLATAKECKNASKSPRGDKRKKSSINKREILQKLSSSEPTRKERRTSASPKINGTLRHKHLNGKTDARNNNLCSRNNNNIKSTETLLEEVPGVHAISRLPSVSSCSGESTSSGIGSCSSSDSLSCKTVPTKVRFPAPQKKDSLGDTCRWRSCGLLLDHNSSLLEHIQAVHVEGQLEAESFRCLWVGCKVFDRASCSVSWLERHVLTHGGNKPFKCIVDGCGQRFTSQTGLGRHVNQHFSSPTTAQPARTQGQPSPNKLIRKNGRKLRYRKKPFSARNFDFFDVSCMEQVRWSLIQVSQFQNQSICSEAITFTPQVIGKRTSLAGVQEALVSWSPKQMLSDEWVSVQEIKPRSIPLSQLTSSMKATAFERCFATARPTDNKRKRKPSA